MPNKAVSLPFQLCSSISMTGTVAFTSSVSSIIYRDSVAYQAAWTGIPTGSFDVQGSIDFNPGLPESGGSSNNGTWTSISISPAFNATGSGGASFGLINLSQLGFAYTRLVYTNSTGSGFLGLWVAGKSFG